MKLLLIILIMFSSTAFAQNFYPFGKAGAKKVYINNLAKCEANEGQACFDITNKSNMARWMIGPVDDLTKPKHRKRDSQACTDKDSCRAIQLVKDCSAYAKRTFIVIAQDYSEVYCAEPNGYNKKDGLVSNPAGIISDDADKAAKAADKGKRKSKRDARLLSLESCAKATTLNAAQEEVCIKTIAKELVKERLLETDL